MLATLLFTLAMAGNPMSLDTLGGSDRDDWAQGEFE